MRYEFRVMSHHGDDVLEFDTATDAEAVEKAMKMFDELVKEHKHIAATRKKGETDYQKVGSFKDVQEESVFTTARSGG